MARPSLFTHPKFLRLSMALGSRMAAAGALECVWRMGYESGDPFVGEAAVVEYACEWKGEPGLLARELVKAGFLEETADGLEIHDLYDHAPEYVKKRKTRHDERAAERRSESPQRRTPSGQCPDSDRTLTRTPTPTPTPNPTPQEVPPLAPPAGGADDGWEAFWGPYPRKAKKPTARKAWNAMSPEDRVAAIAGSRELGEVWEGATSDELALVPHPASWLRARAWEDGRAEWERVRASVNRRSLRVPVALDGGARPALVGAHRKPEKPKRDVTQESPAWVIGVTKAVAHPARPHVPDELYAALERWRNGEVGDSWEPEGWKEALAREIELAVEWDARASGAGGRR